MDQEEIRKNFSVMNNAYCKYSFTYFLDSMERLGLCYIDFWGGIQHFNPFFFNKVDLSKLKKELLKRGLLISAYTPEILAYPFNFASPDERVRTASVEYAKKNIEICADLKVSTMLISPGYGLWDMSIEDSLSWSEESMRKVTEVAETYGIRLALEHLTPQSSNLLTNAARVWKMVEAIGSPYFGAALDLGQMSVFGESVDEYFSLLGEKIFLIHIMDGSPASHLAFGDGILPLKDYYEQVRKRGYQGIITLEINDGRYFMRPHEALEQCIREIAKW